MIEGDSATVAEVCALLSRLAEVPIKQSLAITGSMDQHGEVQAIGGANEKIEGFFDVCNARGLTGEPGGGNPGEQRPAPDAARGRGAGSTGGPVQDLLDRRAWTRRLSS